MLVKKRGRTRASAGLNSDDGSTAMPTVSYAAFTRPDPRSCGSESNDPIIWTRRRSLVPALSPRVLTSYLRGQRRVGITGEIAGIDWAKRWRNTVHGPGEKSTHGEASGYWDRRARSYARITRQRFDDFLRVVEPFLGPRKTLIDVGAGAGRHAVALSERAAA